ncbi:hypothetical protein FHS18_001013 [Paenibacillus phyllosphaerae]|uniref:DUF1572 domain-containing protein n=1 Tax=Paenibacillus phyllosphaerae TaxID=274593 RepID=A0A7W5AVB9_9BACL|nr:DUF1572 family protein [Paenibacillus phyllosphaerae]MBB3108961.1 hypothetical protein [Paenibacillus phyllosphaerae]
MHDHKTAGVSTLASHVLSLSIADFRGLKKLGDRALSQLPEAGYHWASEPESNNIAIIINHLSGNMISRWTDFLTTDGEKASRNRDAEFEDDGASPEELLHRWELGWSALFTALEALKPDDITRVVLIRGERHTVLQAIHRQIAHYGYHVGQLVYVAKAFRSTAWQSLSIPKGGSAAFNEAKGMP